MKIRPRIVIGIPTWGKVSIGWSEARTNIQYPLGCSTSTLSVIGEKIDTARNEIARQAVKLGTTHVLFIADDVIPPANIITQLLSRDKDIVTGIYWTKAYPKEPYIWRGIQQGPYLQWKHGEFFPIDLAGCDALLVKTDVFRKLPEPWFSCNWTWEPDTIPGSLTTEDFYFYTKAKGAGYEVWADTCVQCGHEDRESGVTFYLTDDMPQARQDVKAEDIQKTGRLCADIGCGKFSEYWDGKLMRYDLDESVKPDIRCDVRQIPEPPEKFDEVRARHVLEHFSAWDAPELVAEWLRILKVGGRLLLRVPNLAWAIERLQKQDRNETVPTEELWYAWGVLYGGQEREHTENSFMTHRNGYTARNLKKLLEQVGNVTDITVTETQGGSELTATCIKTATAKPAVLQDFVTQQADGMLHPKAADTEKEKQPCGS